MMNFFEQELRKILGPKYPDATYAGRAAYVRLDGMNRARIGFVTCGTADEYPALGVKILNKESGTVDQVKLRFGDILGCHQAPNINAPFAWTYRGVSEWYGFQPSQQDYQAMSDAVGQYLDVWQEPVMKQRTKKTPTMAEQTM